MTRDLNGRPVQTGPVRRMLGRLTRGGASDRESAPDDADLVVVAESFDDVAASSQVLEDSRWRSAEQAVLRHILVVPEQSIDDVVSTAAQDGYTRVEAAVPPDAPVTAVTGDDAVVRTVIGLARPQLVDALHCSQERSRMAGLGARHGGTVLGWQVLQRRI